MKIPLSSFLGVFISESDDNCFRLQALIQQKAKSALIRGILQDYIFEKNLTIENLVERYAKYMYNEWDIRLRDEIPFEEYTRKMSGELRSKYSIPMELIDKIVEECKEENRKRSVNK